MFISALLVLLCGLWSQQAQASSYQLITGYLPPWSMAGNKTYPGSFVEIARIAAKRAGHDSKVQVYPWGRAQQLSKNDKSVVIFPMARLSEREKLYQWIHPVKKMKMSFVSSKGKELGLDEARQLGRILVHNDAPPEMLLIGKGFDNLIAIHDLSPNIVKMLKYGRADAWFTPQDMAHWVWKFSSDGVEPTFGDAITSHELYFAASLSTDRKIVEDFRKAIRSMLRDGTIKKILARYRKTPLP